MLPNLTIRQLQTFREVMRTGSISEASRALGRTQPAVSAMIAGFERELGFALFVRERGRLVARPEAHYFLEEAEAVLERLDRAARTMAEFGALDRGSLRLACYPAASGFFMPSILADFLRTRPHVKADLMMRSSQVVEDLIASQEYDIGLGETPPPRASVLTRDFDLECLVAVPASSPLAVNEVLTPQDLDRYPMATLFDEHRVYQSLQATFDRAGAVLNRRFVLRTFLPALKLVESGLCAAVIDRITASSLQTDTIVLRRFSPRVASAISILQPAHRPLSQVATAFRDQLSDALSRLEAP